MPLRKSIGIQMRYKAEEQQRKEIHGEKNRLRQLPVNRKMHSEAQREKISKNALYGREKIQRQFIRKDEEKDRQSGVPWIVFEAYADSGARIFKHNI